MHIRSVEVDGKTLTGVRLFHFDQAFHLDRIVEAGEARYAGDGWVLLNGVHRKFSPDNTTEMTFFTDQATNIPLIPDDFSTSLTGNSESMTFEKIQNYIGRFQPEGISFARLLTDYYGRLASPFVTIIMVLVGMSLGLRRSGIRGGGMAVGIGQAFIVGFCYWTTHSIAIALGRGGALAPMLAGWMANILFASFGLYLLLKVRH
jgi:lipopolysaccharide export system permease protein